MHLEHLPLNFDKRRSATGLQTTLRSGATDNALDAAEDRIGHKFPEQVRAFYSRYNGLKVDDPAFEILPIEKISVQDHSRIHFATADGIHRISFECCRLNATNQWDIIDEATGDLITYTMASFWTNKMWKWIDRRLAFWRGEV